MKNIIKKTKKVGLVSACMILAFPLSSAGKTPEKIFHWVAEVLEVTDSHPLPKIEFLDKAELQSTFRQSNEKSKSKWEETYGEQKAKQIMQMYLKELMGLFDPKTKNVYVGNFIDPCRQQAVLAHELAHYFQVMTDRSYDIYFAGSDNVHFLREMEAYGIEKRYRRLFCEATIEVN